MVYVAPTAILAVKAWMSIRRHQSGGRVFRGLPVAEPRAPLGRLDRSTELHIFIDQLQEGRLQREETRRDVVSQRVCEVRLQQRARGMLARTNAADQQFGRS